MDSVAQIFENAGVPEWVWKTIMMVESGGNPKAGNFDGESSIGLFQLNQKGGLGYGYTRSELQNPVVNASIAAKSMGPAYKAGVAKGYKGLDLLRYTAYTGGWPTHQGLKAMNTDPVVKHYDTLLKKEYAMGTLKGLSPDPDAYTDDAVEDAKGIVLSGGSKIASGVSYMAVLIMVAGVAMFSLNKTFTLKG